MSCTHTKSHQLRRGVQLLAVGGASFPVRGGHNSSTLMDVNAVAAQTTDICMGFSGPLAHSWLSAAEQTTSLNMDLR